MRAEPVVNIYANEQLDYTGYLSLAAERCSLEPQHLMTKLLLYRSFPVNQPRLAPDGVTRIPRADNYTARLRD
jgi:hypothetical protein